MVTGLQEYGDVATDTKTANVLNYFSANTTGCKTANVD